MANPPPAPSVPANTGTSGRNAAGVTTGKQLDPFGLGSYDGTNLLGDKLIFGSQNFFYGDRGVVEAPGLKGVHIKAPTRTPLTATQTIQAFTKMTGPKLALVQSQLYRAGFYSGNYVPMYGRLRQEDIAAFRDMIVGLAANPAQGKLADFLGESADAGDKSGVNLKTRAPLVIKLTSPDDLRAVIQNTARDLYGGNLPEEDIQRLIGAYNGLERTAQTTAYNAGDSNLTGTLDGGIGGEVTTVPNAEAFAQSQIKSAHPEQVAATQFGAAMDTILSTLKGSPGA